MWRPNGIGDLQLGERCARTFYITKIFYLTDTSTGSVTWTSSCCRQSST
jgi:hypothetical protein